MRTDRRKDGRTERQTELTKLIVAFRNCANPPKNKVARTINTPRRGYSQCISNVVSRCAAQQAFWSLETRGGCVNVGVSHGVGTATSFLSHTVTVSEETGFLAVQTVAVGRNFILMKRNIEARCCNNCCRGKAMSITYCECVFVALVGIPPSLLCNGYRVISGERKVGVWR
jgi:hypothetical protein